MKPILLGYSTYILIPKGAKTTQMIDENTQLYWVPPTAHKLGPNYLVYSMEGDKADPMAQLSASATKILEIMADTNKRRISKVNMMSNFKRTYSPGKAQMMIEDGITELINKKKITEFSKYDLYIELL